MKRDELQLQMKIAAVIQRHAASITARIDNFDPLHSKGPVFAAQQVLQPAGLYDFAEQHLRKFMDRFIVPENPDGNSSTAAFALMKLLLIRGRALYEVAQCADWARKYNDVFETHGSGRNLFRGEITLESARALILSGEVDDPRRMLQHMRKSRATVACQQRIDVADATVEHLASPSSGKAAEMLGLIEVPAGEFDEDLLIELGQAHAFIGDAPGAVRCVDRAMLAWSKWSGRRHPFDIVLSKFAQPLAQDSLFAPLVAFANHFIANTIKTQGKALRAKLDVQLKEWPIVPPSP
jgi:hypothetical protein